MRLHLRDGHRRPAGTLDFGQLTPRWLQAGIVLAEVIIFTIAKLAITNIISSRFVQEPAMKPEVQPFFHADSNTWSYVVREPDGAAAAVIDAVLDFDAKAARTSTASAQQLVDFVDAHGLQ